MLLSLTSQFDIDSQANPPQVKAKAAKPVVAADISASASQVYHYDASIDFTI